MKYAARLGLPGVFLLSCSVASGQVTGVTATVGSVGQTSPTAQAAVVCSMTVMPVRGTLVSEEVTPYSATQESSRTQTLSDGTVIAPKMPTEKVWRDSQNRTRRERPFCTTREIPEAATYVEIRDPVAGYAYILDPTTHTAHRYALQVKPNAAPPPKAAGREAVAAAPTRSGALFANTNAVSEPLGSQVMEGVPVEGSRTTETVPTGQMDNDRPFSIVRETWISPALHVVVYSKTSDPRFGETITRLSSVELIEPDPTLFRPPADYALVDDGEPVKLTVQRPNSAPPQK